MKKELKYFKFKDFTKISDRIDEYLSEFTDEIIELLPEEIDAQSIDFILYELLINVYKHSKFENAYLLVPTLKNNENFCICIYDNGIGIPGSFKEAGMESINDCEAIYEAINGKTSDKEKYGLHGRGLNSTVRITTLGFNGKILIASGKGICLISEKGAETYSNNNTIKGTLIILKIQNRNINNIYEYLKHENINKNKEDNHDKI